MTVLEFAKYLLQLKPETNAARLSLYHYLKNHCVTSDELTADVLYGFYTRALTFSHWREHKGELAVEVKSLLESFLESHETKLSPLRHADEMQVLEIENLIDVYEMVKSFFSFLPETDRLRILPDGEERLIALVLKPDGSLLIHDFNRWAIIRNGQLEPLCQDLSVKYTRELELAPDYRHHIQVQPGITSRFSFKPSGISAHIFRGFVFQKIEEFTDIPLSKAPVLFYPLKRLERFFINRSTDPLYIELTNLLEQAITLLRDGHPEARHLGTSAFDRGQNALRLIFPNDKLLSLLLRELSDLLLKTEGQNESLFQENTP